MLRLVVSGIRLLYPPTEHLQFECERAVPYERAAVNACLVARDTAEDLLAMLLLVLASSGVCSPGSRIVMTTPQLSRVTQCRMGPPPGFKEPPSPRDGDYVDIICRGLNSAMEKTVITRPILAAAQVRDASPQGDKKGQDFFWATVKSSPELPGLSRPVWLTIAAVSLCRVSKVTASSRHATRWSPPPPFGRYC